MRLIRSATESEMVVAYLQGDCLSARPSSSVYIRQALGARAESLVLHPNLGDATENAERLKALRLRREVTDLLDWCGEALDWRLLAATIDELRNVRLLGYDTFRELAPQTRTVGEAAANVDDAQIVVSECLKERVRAIEQSLQARGVTTPPPIAIAPMPAAPLTLLDGNTRAIAYARFFSTEDEIEVFAGYHPQVDSWWRYRA